MSHEMRTSTGWFETHDISNLKGDQKQKDKETKEAKKPTIPSNNATPTQKLYRILVLASMLE